MRKSTNKLTKHESKYASSPTYPQIKHEVMQKANFLFNSLGQKLSQLESQPAPFKNLPFKISKGENLEHMPYLVLDYPQLKDRDFKMVFRSLFWWGHHLSCQLIISKAAIHSEPTCINLAGMSKSRILSGSNLWNYNGRSTDYHKLKHLDYLQVKQILENQSHLKLISIFSIEGMNTFEVKALTCFEQWMDKIVWA